MINFKQGFIKTVEGEQKDIVVKAASANTLRDNLIGCGLVSLGIAYLTYTAFRNGSRAFELAEFNTLTELGLTSSKTTE